MIQENAVLVRLQISQWSARKFDKKVTQEVHANHGATSDAGRYNKHLIPGDAPSYKALTQWLSAIRTKHYEETLIWSDEGLRLLPVANRSHYRELVGQWKAETARLLSEFLRDYPALRENARSRLNGMFNPTDYPNVADLENKFSVTAEEYPVPDGSHFQTFVENDVREELNRRVQRATETAMNDAWSRLYSCVEHLHERLAQPGAIFRDSLVTNVREVCDVLRRLNVTGSAELEQMRATVEADLSRYDPETLRENDQVRANVAQTAETIMTAIRGTRRIKVLNPRVESEVITSQEEG